MRLSTSFSSCLDSVEAVFESDAGMAGADDGKDFVPDGGRVGAIFLGGNHLGDKGVARIIDGLEDHCREYYKLYLCDNRIGHQGASIISCSLKYNTTLMELSLGNNHIGDEGARHLASLLVVNDSLEMLNLENNNIGPAGITALATALEHDNNSLRCLVLSENPIGDEGALSMLQCIGNSFSLDHLQRCNHSLLSVILKKVTQVKDTTTLRKIQSYLKTNRLAVPSPISASQRKIFLYVKENPNALLDYVSILRRDDTEKEMYGCMALILALLGKQYDLSSTFVVLKHSPHLFSNDSDSEIPW